MIYFDNAATGGRKPQTVISAVTEALKELCSNPGRGGYERSSKAEQKIFDARHKFYKLVNCENETNVCFTHNCTHAINAVLRGVLNCGDHLIISSLEHNAVWRTVNYLQSEKNIEFDIAEVDLNDDEITVKNIESLIKTNTKLIFVTAASNVIGKRLPLCAIGELCRRKGIAFGVDGAQAVGIVPIDMDKMNIDYLCIAPHKGLYAPMGVGVLVARKRIQNIIISGGTGSNSIENSQPDDLPERIESGTVSVPGIVGCSAGIDFVNSIGMDKIYSEEIKICKYIYRGLREIGAKLYVGEPDIYRYAPVISFNIENVQSEELGAYLGKNGIAVRSGLHCAPLAHKSINTLDTGTVRISPSIYNNLKDVERLFFILKKAI